MEEKKINEIIKAIQYNAKDGRGIGYIDGYKCKAIKFADILDLIHCLQGENDKPKRKKILANKVYSDATLKSWKKEDLIEQIRILEHNWSAAEEALNNSAKNSEKIITEQKAEIERLTERAERAAICEKEYLEWATGFLKTRFDIKDWFTNPEHQRTPCTYEFFASTLWEKIKSAMHWLYELEEREETLRKENSELQKQVDEYKAKIEQGTLIELP